MISHQIRHLTHANKTKVQFPLVQFHWWMHWLIETTPQTKTDKTNSNKRLSKWTMWDEIPKPNPSPNRNPNHNPNRNPNRNRYRIKSWMMSAFVSLEISRYRKTTKSRGLWLTGGRLAVFLVKMTQYLPQINVCQHPYCSERICDAYIKH